MNAKEKAYSKLQHLSWFKFLGSGRKRTLNKCFDIAILETRKEVAKEILRKIEILGKNEEYDEDGILIKYFHYDGTDLEKLKKEYGVDE